MGQSQISAFGVYAVDQGIGEGAFGKVYKVHRNDNPTKFYALKVLQCSSNEDLEFVVNEMKALSQLSHPNIIKLIETKCKQKEKFTAEVYLVMEYCSGGNLEHHLSQTPYNTATNLRWMRQLASAVNYIHFQYLVHRDLKPDNILLTACGNIKVGDFGLARNFSALKNENETWVSYYMNEGCGTLYYIAPEVFDDHYSEKADIFALGILLYAIVERQYQESQGKRFYGVFVDKPSIGRVPLGLQLSLDKTGISIPFNKATKDLITIICPALLFDQKLRPTALQILQQLNNI